MSFAINADYAVTRDLFLPLAKLRLISTRPANTLIQIQIYAAYSKNVLKNAIIAEA